MPAAPRGARPPTKSLGLCCFVPGSVLGESVGRSPFQCRVILPGVSGPGLTYPFNRGQASGSFQTGAAAAEAAGAALVRVLWQTRDLFLSGTYLGAELLSRSVHDVRTLCVCPCLSVPFSLGVCLGLSWSLCVCVSVSPSASILPMLVLSFPLPILHPGKALTPACRAVCSPHPAFLLLPHRTPPPSMAPLALVGVALLLGVPPCSGAATPTPSLPPPPANDSDASTGVCQGSNRCQPGVLLPVWEPDDPSLGDKAARAVVYFVAMVYMFLGVSIIADRFMASIEVITSKEKEITITKANGETSVGTVRIWNETVSNLTLMALGSSAPEILLSVIEVCGHNFQAGELGPGTIVGSAAFNMFVVIAVCIYVIPAGESRKIKHLRVFFVTASWSIFAYVWLYLILAVFSPGVVQVWEALLTLVFFPVCVVFAWMADKRLLFYKYVYKRYRTDPRSGIIIGAEGDPPKSIELDGTFVGAEAPGEVGGLGPGPSEARELDASRREVIQILKDLKQKHPDKDLEQLVGIANYYALLHQQKSRAFYRIQATRLMTGAGNVLRRHAADASRRACPADGPAEDEDDGASHIFFEPSLYHCLENCGSVLLSVTCEGGEGNSTFYVDYRTEDGSAKAGSDYEYSEGTLVFKPGETQKELRIGIIDDDIFEEDEHFFVRLLNLRVGDAQGMFEPDGGGRPKGRLVAPLLATVTILDDDHAGIFSFQDRLLHVSECMGTVDVRVVRSSGARGTVRLPYRTVDGTARGGGVHYEDACGELEFGDDETMKTLQVKIVDDEEYEKKDNFFIELGQPQWLKRGISALLLNQGDGDRKLTAEEEEARRIAEMGKPVLGENCRLEVIIEESYDFKNTVDKLIKKTNLALVIGTHSWREQFLEAITVSAGAVRLRPAHRVLPWLGLLRRLHPGHRPAHRPHRRPRLPLRLHRWPQGLRQRRGLRGPGHLHPRHVRQQGGGPAGPVRGRVHRQRDGLQRRERVLGPGRGLVGGRRVLGGAGPAVRGAHRHAGLLRDALHRLRLRGHRRAAVPAPAAHRWGAGRPARPQARHHGALPGPLVPLHPLRQPRGLLPHPGLLAPSAETRPGPPTPAPPETAAPPPSRDSTSWNSASLPPGN
ncbi:sodium/calcium exchanger 2 isoform X2 [Pteropus medius]|uniref:sodium/calcium exchanger 2 isoform X2 n=1 Tax=Pteropus vampyrus TaxID=132908 RepID=UPI00196AC59F|nr:sodium/calcium exchanger 2 isoform X2 [Pteropus giganteus]